MNHINKFTTALKLKNNFLVLFSLFVVSCSFPFSPTADTDDFIEPQGLNTRPNAGILYKAAFTLAELKSCAIERTSLSLKKCPSFEGLSSYIEILKQVNVRSGQICNKQQFNLLKPQLKNQDYNDEVLVCVTGENRPFVGIIFKNNTTRQSYKVQHVYLTKEVINEF